VVSFHVAIVTLSAARILVWYPHETRFFAALRMTDGLYIATERDSFLTTDDSPLVADG
jgi:hypothetical protein